MHFQFRRPAPRRHPALVCLALLAAMVLLLLAGCHGGGAGAGAAGGPGGGGPQALPVPIATVADVDLQDSSEYVATLKSRHTTTVQPQVEGFLRRINVKSGDRVAAGTRLMEIDPEKQRATVNSQEAARALKLAALNYAKVQRQRMETLFQGGAASKQQVDEAQSALEQAQADYDSLGAQVREQQVELGYYTVAAPSAGVVGDIPVRVGDRVTTSTLLTTLDQNDALEAYISVPLERAKDLRLGLPVEILGDGGDRLAESKVYFIAPQVDDQTQQVLVKAPVPNGARNLRADQFVRARIVWSTHRGPVVPVLSVSRVNGQYFVFAATPGGPNGTLVAHQKPVRLGDIVGDNYVVLSGLTVGEQVVSSGVQKLFDGMPIMNMPPPPAGAGGAGGGPGGGDAGGPGAGAPAAGSSGGSSSGTGSGAGAGAPASGGGNGSGSGAAGSGAAPASQGTGA